MAEKKSKSNHFFMPEKPEKNAIYLPKNKISEKKKEKKKALKIWISENQNAISPEGFHDEERGMKLCAFLLSDVL